MNLRNKEVRDKWIADNQAHFKAIVTAINYDESSEESDEALIFLRDAGIDFNLHSYDSIRSTEGDCDGGIMLMYFTYDIDYHFIVGTTEGYYNSCDGFDFSYSTYYELVERYSITSDYVRLSSSTTTPKENVNALVKQLNDLIK